MKNYIFYAIAILALLLGLSVLVSVPYQVKTYVQNHQEELKGEKGDKGERGRRGKQGIQGLRGYTGLQGEQGEKGQDGERNWFPF